MASTEPQRGDARAQFLTVAEVADTLRVSRMTVYRLIHSGEVPSMRVGHTFRVPKTAVDAMLSQIYEADGFDSGSRAAND
ncbi:MAG TPA: helix-turn-helix domain-containing protein [Actinomycetales bacterium]|nr:helix-turn-helix domain-containing protein [Actinomycetales bacterium]